MGESFDHRPAGWIRQSSKCCTQFIHNHMVVDYPPMSSMNFAIPDFCSLMLFHQLLEASERHNLGERHMHSICTGLGTEGSRSFIN